MFTRKMFSIVVVSLLVSASGSVALAQRPGARLARMKNFLALTDQQVSDIKDLLKKNQQAAFPLRQDLRTRNQDLQKAFDAPEPNPNAVGQLVIARHALRSQLRALNEKLRADILAKLTPEQKQKFEQAIARRNRRGARG